MAGQVTVEARLDQLRVLAVGDAEQAVGHDLAPAHLAADQHLELARDGQEQQVRGADAVHGRDERDGDAAAELVRVGQVLHHVDEPEHRAEDADRGRVAACRLPDLGGRAMALLPGLGLDVERLADALRLEAVDQHLQAVAHERVGGRRHLVLEGQHAVAAGRGRPLGDARDDDLGVERGRQQHPARELQRVAEDRQRALHHDGRQRAADDDEERGQLHERADVAAFQQLSADDGDGRQ